MEINYKKLLKLLVPVFRQGIFAYHFQKALAETKDPALVVKIAARKTFDFKNNGK